MSEFREICSRAICFLLGAFLLSVSANLHAQNNLDSALNVLEKSKNPSEKTQTLDYLRRRSNNPSDQIRYANQLLELIEDKDSLRFRLDVNATIGFAYKQLGNYTKACEYFYQNAEIANANGWIVEESYALGNLATTLNIVGDYAESARLLRRSLQIGYELQDSDFVHPTLINIGNVYHYLEAYDTSLYYLRESIKYAKGDPYEDYYNAYSKGTAALVFARMGNVDTAQYLLKASIKEWEKYQDYYPIAECLVQIAETYFNMGLLGQAIVSAKEGFDLSVQHDFQQFQRDGAKLLFEVYKQQKKLDSAIYFQSIYFRTKDSIQNIESVKKVEAERTNFEVSKKQTEVDLLETQKRAREQFLLGLSIIAVLLVAGAIFIYRSYRLQQKLSIELAVQKEKLEELNASKDKLFSILSHDLRGPIAAFGGVSQMIKLAVKNNSLSLLNEIADEVKKTATKLSDTLENLLSWAIQERGLLEMSPVNLEVKTLFKDLEEMYHQQAQMKNIQFINKGQNDLSLHIDKNAAYTILRNLISNALKFTPNRGLITLSAKPKGSQILIEVQDSGLGINEAKLKDLFKFNKDKSSFGTAGEKGLGLGLSLVYEMVTANNGTITVTSEVNKGTTFSILLPGA